jgi:hypothetical protein
VKVCQLAKASVVILVDVCNCVACTLMYHPKYHTLFQAFYSEYDNCILIRKRQVHSVFVLGTRIMKKFVNYAKNWHLIHFISIAVWLIPVCADSNNQTFHSVSGILFAY